MKGRGIGVRKEKADVWGEGRKRKGIDRAMGGKEIGG